MWCFVAGRHKHQEQGHERKSVNESLLYTPHVLRCLERSNLLVPGRSNRDASRVLAVYEDKIVCAALLAFKEVPSLATQLLPCEREILDFHFSTKYDSCPVVLLKSLEIRRLDPPCAFYTQTGTRKSASSMFTTMTLASFDRCCASLGRTRQALLDEMRAACTHHNLNVDIAMSNTQLVVLVPTPHALLFATGSWPSLGFPFLARAAAAASRMRACSGGHSSPQFSNE